MLLLQLKWLCLELQLCLAVTVKYTHSDLMQLWFRRSRSCGLPFQHEQSKGQATLSKNFQVNKPIVLRDEHIDCFNSIKHTDDFWDRSMP